jgi:membrane protease YdiL (CAAX protease family)
MSEPAPESFINPRPSGVVDPRERATAILEILLCSSIPTQLAIGALLRLAGIPSTDAAGHLSLTFVLVLSLADTALLIVMMVFFMRVHGEAPRVTWFGTRRWFREILVGIGTVPVVFIVVGILLNTIRLFAPALHNVENNPLEQLAATPGQAPVFSLVAIIAGGVREELQRAFMLRRFEQYLGGATVGVWVLSVAFGLGHVMQGWDAVITTGTLGAFWAWMYLQRRNSIGAIVSHAGFNSLEILRVAMIGQ